MKRQPKLLRPRHACTLQQYMMAIILLIFSITLLVNYRLNHLVSMSRTQEHPGTQASDMSHWKVAFRQINESRIDYKAQVVPPRLLLPPQLKNGFQSFTTQVLQYNLSPYQASPAVQHDGLRSDDPNAPARTLHFIFLASDEEKTREPFVSFSLLNYLVVRAAFFRLQPDKIYLHVNRPPLDCPYWHLIKPMITEVKTIELVKSIYGNKVSGKAHLSDILRLKILQKYGGLYMDIDCIAVRPLPFHLWNPKSGLMMGLQYKKHHRMGVSVIVARKDSRFIRRWLETYRTFDDSKWDAHTVGMAGRLARKYPNEIDVSPIEYFYYPSWRTKSFRLLWEVHPVNDTNLYDFSRTYISHYWNTIAHSGGYASRVTPFTILMENAAINQILRPLLPNPFFTVEISCYTISNNSDIETTISSILNQTFPLWEILLSDSNPSGVCAVHVLKTIAGKYARLQKNIPRSIRSTPYRERVEDHARGIWMVRLHPGDRIRTSDEFVSVLKSAEADKKAFHHSINDRNYSFVFNGTSRVTRVTQD